MHKAVMALVEASDDVASLISAGDFDRARKPASKLLESAEELMSFVTKEIDRASSQLSCCTVVVDVANSGAFSTIGVVVVTLLLAIICSAAMIWYCIISGVKRKN